MWSRTLISFLFYVLAGLFVLSIGAAITFLALNNLFYSFVSFVSAIIIFWVWRKKSISAYGDFFFETWLNKVTFIWRLRVWLGKPIIGYSRPQVILFCLFCTAVSGHLVWYKDLLSTTPIYSSQPSLNDEQRARARLLREAVRQAPLDTVRLLLDNEDIEGLQATIFLLQEQAIEQRDATVLRDVYNRFFNTTHENRIKTINAWADTNPHSPFAQTAKAWVALKKVKMFGRGYEYPSSSPQRQKKYLEARKEAEILVSHAYRQSKDFVPAIDAAITARSFISGNRTLSKLEGSVGQHLMELSPDRQSVLKLVNLAISSHSIPTEAVYDVCSNFSVQARNYSVDKCMIEASMRNYLHKDLRDIAKELIPSIDDPALADIKLRDLMDTDGFWDKPPSQDLLNQVEELLVQARQSGIDPLDYGKIHGGINRFLDDEALVLENNETFYEYIDSYLQDDPYNQYLLLTKLEVLVRALFDYDHPEDLRRARAIWPNALKYGHDGERIWLLGDWLVGADRDPYDIEDRMVFMENHIVHTHQSIYSMFQYFHRMSDARKDAEARLGKPVADGDPDPSTVLELIKCPMLRAAKLISLLCRAEPENYGHSCTVDKPYFELVPTVLEEGHQGSCPAVTSRPASEQRYTPVPYEEIKIPWLNDAKPEG